MDLFKRYIYIPLLLVLFVVLSVLVYNEVKRKTLDEFQNQELMLARQAARGIEGFFIYYHRELQFLSQIPYVVDMDHQGEALMNNFYINHSDQIEAITRVDENGVLVYTFPYTEKMLVGQDLSFQEHIRKVLKTHKPVVSDVFETVQGYLAIAYHVPVFKGAEFKGSLALLIPIDKLGERYLENIRLGSSGYAYMLSQNMFELYCPQPGHTGLRFDARGDLEDELTTKLLALDKGEGLNYGFFHGRIYPDRQSDKKVLAIIYRVALGNTYWDIIISTPESEVYATLKGFRNKLFLLVFFILSILFFYLHYHVKVQSIMKEEQRRRAAEKALAESEERWNFALEGSGDGVWDRDISSGVVYYSPRWKAMLGYENHEIANRYEEWESRVHPDDLPQVLALVKQHLESEIQMYEAEYRIRCKDGQYKWILDRGKVISKDEKGKPLRMVGTHSDISARKRDEEQLQTLMRAVDQSPASIIITDLHGKIEYVNRKFVDQSGYSLEEVRDKTPGMLKSGLVPDEVYGELWKTISSGRTWVGEFQNKKKNGEVFWESALISPVQNGSGEILHYIAVKEDVTEKKQLVRELLQAKEKAEESDRLKSSFLQNMSHEIRTPMNAILGFSDLLGNADTSQEDRSSYISIIKDSGNQLLSIVNNILTISFIDTKQEKIELRRVEPEKMLQQLHSIFISEADRKGISLRINPDKRNKDFACMTDATKLNQILTNLIANALKFTHKGSVVAGYEVGEEQIEFYVSDSGIGIDPKVQKEIFDRFTQADDTIRINYGGTGLGLSIASAFVELLGGEISLKSVPGEGSIFTFTIPFIPDKGENKTEEMSKIQGKAEKMDAAVILVAEDEDFNFLLIKEFFKDEPVKVLHAANGREAVDICRTDQQIDLVLMDIKMPELNGEKATKMIKELRPDLPVIAQSAYAIESEIRKYLAIGFDDYITKPIIKEELLQKSARILNNRN